MQFGKILRIGNTISNYRTTERRNVKSNVFDFFPFRREEGEKTFWGKSHPSLKSDKGGYGLGHTHPYPPIPQGAIK